MIDNVAEGQINFLRRIADRGQRKVPLRTVPRSQAQPLIEAGLIAIDGAHFVLTGDGKTFLERKDREDDDHDFL